MPFVLYSGELGDASIPGFSEGGVEMWVFVPELEPLQYCLDFGVYGWVFVWAKC